MPVAFVCSPIRGIYGGGFWRVVALKALLLEGEKLGDPVRTLCHRELMVGGGCVLGLCDGRMVEVEEVDGSRGRRGRGLWRPSSMGLASSGRRIGARDCFAGWWALGWAWWGEALAALRGDFCDVLGAPVGLVLGADTPDGVGVAELQGVALWLVRGASALIELLLVVPLHPDLHQTVWAWVLEAVLDPTLTRDPLARVVIAERLLDFRAFLGRCLRREGG